MGSLVFEWIALFLFFQLASSRLSRNKIRSENISNDHLINEKPLIDFFQNMAVMLQSNSTNENGKKRNANDLIQLYCNTYSTEHCNEVKRVILFLNKEIKGTEEIQRENTTSPQEQSNGLNRKLENNGRVKDIPTTIRKKRSTGEPQTLGSSTHIQHLFSSNQAGVPQTQPVGMPANQASIVIAPPPVANNGYSPYVYAPVEQSRIVSGPHGAYFNPYQTIPATHQHGVGLPQPPIHNSPYYPSVGGVEDGSNHFNQQIGPEQKTSYSHVNSKLGYISPKQRGTSPIKIPVGSQIPLVLNHAAPPILIQHRSSPLFFADAPPYIEVHSNPNPVLRYFNIPRKIRHNYEISSKTFGEELDCFINPCL